MINSNETFIKCCRCKSSCLKSYFYKSKNMSDGLHPQYKFCATKYYNDNREKTRKYYLENRDEDKNYQLKTAIKLTLE